MRNLFCCLIVYFISGFVNSDNCILFAQKNSYTQSAFVGDSKINLPQIEGMTQYSIDSIYEGYSERFLKSGNHLLAFFVNLKTLEQIKNDPGQKFSDYCIIYAPKSSENKILKDSDLEEMAIMYKNSSIDWRESWKTIKKQNNDVFKDFSFGEPVLIESYSINQSIRSFVTLTKISTPKRTIVNINALNMAKVKNKLVFIAYYKFYEGVSSIEKIKADNDYFVLRLLAENKY